MIALALALLVSVRQAPGDSFPHYQHRRVFATCTTCHAGILNGDSSRTRPPASACTACHDGTTLRRVDWVPAPPRPTNLRFDHRAHFSRQRSAGDTAIVCATCHASATQAVFMEVGRARPETCITCHAHEAPAHLATANCGTCHRPLREATRLASADIATFPKPPSHDSGFVFRHGRETQGGNCAFCHTRDFCASCHVNASRLPAIASLGSNPRVAELVAARAAPTYPTPATHRSPNFTYAHGALAAQTGATCASCHTRESCLACHRGGELPGAIAALPRRSNGGAAGVQLAFTRPASHVPGFSVNHASAAAGGAQACASCHAESFCASCHDASSSPRFHPRDFVQRHGTASLTNAAECSTCHQPEAFCVSCHRETGRASGTGAAAGKYHDNRPFWVFAHGGVARRSIETCASCHRQTDCLQCHSASSGWRVNPHGRDFDPGMGSRNPGLCLRCHITGPPSQ